MSYKMLKKYKVFIPIAGYIYKEVEANNKKDAIDKVMKNGYENEDIVELDMYQEVNQGNVCHLNISKAYAEQYN